MIWGAFTPDGLYDLWQISNTTQKNYQSILYNHRLPFGPLLGSDISAG